MRILYLVHQFFPEFASGTERVTLQLAQAQQRAGHHVQVLACRVQALAQPGPAGPLPASHSLMVEGVPVVLLDHASLPGHADTAFDVVEPLCQALQAWLVAQAFDVVHLMHAMRMGTAIAAVQRAGLPLVVTATDFHLACLRINLVDTAGQACSGPDQGRACARKCLGPAWHASSLQQRHQQAHSILAAAHARIAPSAFVARQLQQAFGELPVHVVPHGVDLLALAQAAGPRVARSGASAALQLGFIGSLIVPKGLDLLLQALALQPALPVQLQVAGAFHDDAAFEARVRALAAADPRVTLLGPLDRAGVAQLLRRLDLLCLPSRVPETYSLTVHEAAAMGVPALVADRGAPAQALRDSGAGAVVADDRPETWAAALAGWAADPMLRQRWQRAVRLPPRVEEEAFLCESLYLDAVDAVGAVDARDAAGATAT